VRTCVLLAVGLASACAGPAGQDGLDGDDGQAGRACWDLDADGEQDQDEDSNGDGTVDVLDCRASDESDPITPYLGDLFLSDRTVAQEFCRRHDRVYGDLVVERSYNGDDLSALDCLIEVRGSLEIQSVPDLDAVDLYNLEWITQDLEISTHRAYRVFLPGLAGVEGDVRVSDSSLHTLSLPALAYAGGDLHVKGARVLKLGSLTEVYGRVMVTDSGVSDLAGMDALQETGGLILGDNPGLQDITALESLHTVHGSVWIAECPRLSETRVRVMLDEIQVEGDVVLEGLGP